MDTLGDLLADALAAFKAGDAATLVDRLRAVDDLLEADPNRVPTSRQLIRMLTEIGRRVWDIDRGLRAGAVATVAGQTTYDVGFASAMPGDDFRVVLTPQQDMGSVRMWVAARTAQGFRLRLSAAVAGTVYYVAVEDR